MFDEKKFYFEKFRIFNGEFGNRDLHIILKLRNLEIGENLIIEQFSHYLKIRLLLIFV